MGSPKQKMRSIQRNKSGAGLDIIGDRVEMMRRESDLFGSVRGLIFDNERFLTCSRCRMLKMNR